jgi:hypothetical protein
VRPITPAGGPVLDPLPSRSRRMLTGVTPLDA